MASQALGAGQRPEKLQGHWALARAGKRVLRPGGIELTRQMIEALEVQPQDRVVEFAPGLGITAEMVLSRNPWSYSGVEREPAAAEQLRQRLGHLGANIVQASAEQTGLTTGQATVVYGEAMLTMQTAEHKSRILEEARRLLAPGGRYAIHEICLLPDGIDAATRWDIEATLSKEIHVGVQPLTRAEWMALFERHGMHVMWQREAPMRLLEPSRIVRDEGLLRTLRFMATVATHPALRRRVCAMRGLFRRYADHLGAFALVATRA